jgi:hypothetical protein
MFVLWFNFDLQIVVENLSMKQMEEEVELRGPPVSKAFDQEGKPSKVSYPKRSWTFLWYPSAAYLWVLWLSVLF